MKLADFAKQHGLKLEFVKLLGRSGQDPKWRAHHYQCRLSANGRSYLFNYSKGVGCVDSRKRPAPPKLVECLDSLLSDCQGVAYGQRFEEWAGDVGYDSDSRTAYNVYLAVCETVDGLRSLFGRETFATFLELEGE